MHSHPFQVFLRGADPTDADEYETGSLYMHSYDLLDLDDNTKTFEEKIELVCKRLGLTKDEGPELSSSGLRQCTHQLYIENRQIAVEAMRDGITISGE